MNCLKCKKSDEVVTTEKGRYCLDCGEQLFFPKPDSMWLVVVECRYEVIHVDILGKGFYIPGQEPCWAFSHVSEWIHEIIPEKYDSQND